jgi:glucokinase
MIENNPDKIDGKTAFIAAKNGDEAGKKIVSQFIEYLGIGITNMVNIFQPEAIVIGGGLSKEGDYLLEPLREYVKKNSYEPDEIEGTKILAAKLGNDAGIIGAAMLCKQIKS